MTDDFLLRALARAKPAEILSHISQIEGDVRNDKPLSDNSFLAFRTFLTPEADAQKSGRAIANRDRADARAGAPARGECVDGKVGNARNSNTVSELAVLTPTLINEKNEKCEKRPGLLALVGRAAPESSFDPEDIQAYFDERAGIREYDGEMTRAEAEAAAVEDTIAAARDGRLAARPTPDKRVRF